MQSRLKTMKATRCAVRMELQLALLLFKVRAFHLWGKVETYRDGFRRLKHPGYSETGDWRLAALLIPVGRLIHSVDKWAWNLQEAQERETLH